MGRPLKINNTTPKSLKEMSNSEIEFVSHVILSDFVSSSTGTGTISVNPADITGLTNIGSFSDTKFTAAVIGDKVPQYVGSYQNVYQQDYSGTFNTTYLRVSLGYYIKSFGGGGGNFFSGFSGPTYVGNYTGNYTEAYPGTYSTLYTGAFSGNFSPGIGSLLSETKYDFYQDLRTVSESVERPLESRSGGIKQQDDDAINEYIIGVTNDYYLNNGLGNYVLQTTTPSYGGTWTQISTIVDTNQTSNINYYLWRRTDQTPPSTTRPLKYRLNGNRYDLIEMSNTEIQTLTARFRNRIVETGVGKFVLQETAPVSGTWVQRGVDVNDTRQDVAVENFALGYTKDYIGNYETLNYTKTYLGNYTKTYSGVYSGVYLRTSIGYYTRTFSGFNGPTFVGYFTGYFTGAFTGFFSGPTYVGNYDKAYQGTFLGTYSNVYAGMDYAADVIQSSLETISTVKLWQRTA